MIIGLTGGIGSGKSTVASYFRDLGIGVIDTDEIAKKLLAPEQPLFKKVMQHFGEKILEKNGTLNRSKLRTLVFESITERHWLETLLHPPIKEKVLQYANDQKFRNEMPYLIVEIPLLIEAHFEDIVDRILVVDCPSDLQIERVQQRDAIPLNIIQQIMQTQIDRNRRLQEADDVIENTRDKEALKNNVFTLHHYYIELSK